jgi:hypothetical protein
MPLNEAKSWTELYYHVIEYYYWRPQLIGRSSARELTKQSWKDWENKLKLQEAPLNHVLNFLFCIAPSELLDRVVSDLLERELSNMRYVAFAQGAIDENVTQPDFVIRNDESLVFIEMKVDSRSSIDQYVKYAIAAECVLRKEPAIKTIDLVILT